MNRLSQSSVSNIDPSDVGALRDLPAWQKIQMLAELSAKEKSAIVDDLKSYYQGAGEAEFRWLLLNRLHGEEIAIRFLGTLDEARNYDNGL